MLKGNQAQFESSVNSEYSKTRSRSYGQRAMFESSVNSEYSKTYIYAFLFHYLFESSVNSEYSKTPRKLNSYGTGLRVV